MRMQNTIMRTPAARMRSFFSSGAREALVRPSTRIRIVYMKTMAKDADVAVDTLEGYENQKKELDACVESIKYLREELGLGVCTPKKKA